MSWGAVPASWLMKLAKLQGMYEQLPLFETIPEYEIDEKYLCDVFDGYSCKINEYGNRTGTVSHSDHPAFLKLREVLGSRGYVKIQTMWSNGDTVTKEFYLNDKLFKEGEQFPCATAMSYTLNTQEYYESND